MPIKILPDQLASQIAAGEVVERPASVVKELVENAIDAGATTINIEIRGGGRQLIQVADDGCGIPADEIETAFQRHATSKLETAEDLKAIRSLGFRGEALAAIAAVSQVVVVSRAKDEKAGVRLTLDGGHLTGRETIGAPQGTVLAVSNLFYNVPARLKFLKTVTTEKRHIDEFVTNYALAYPGIRFRLSHDNRITFQTGGSGDLLDVLIAVYGPDMARELLPVGLASDPEADGAAGEPATAADTASTVVVSGYVGPPNLNRANRNRITLFVNGRWIKDHRLTYAVIQAYHTLLPVGRYPVAVLFLTLPPESVDVNVHPTKAEVRFRRSNEAFSAVQRAVRRTLLADSPVPHASHFDAFNRPTWAGATEKPAFSRRERGESEGQLGLDWSADQLTRASGEGQDVPGGERLPIMRVVGQVGAAYIITEGPDGLYLIDQHAAHERILYEQFMADWEAAGSTEGMTAQGLVSGQAVHLSPSQATLLEEQLDLLNRIGFSIEVFGPNSFMVRSLPALLTKLDPAKALLDVVEDLEQGEVPLQKTVESRIILRVCKTAAVKAGQTLSAQEMEAMIRQLESCQNPHTCPHGRPTLIHLSVSQLAKEFGRI